MFFGCPNNSGQWWTKNLSLKILDVQIFCYTNILFQRPNFLLILLMNKSLWVETESWKLVKRSLNFLLNFKSWTSNHFYRTLPIPILESEPVPERPPKKSSPTEDCSRRIEEAARELKNLRTTSSSGRKPRAPDPPFNSQIGLRWGVLAYKSI